MGRPKSHSGVHHQYNKFASLGNVKEHHKTIFNELYDLRTPARHLRGKSLNITLEQARKYKKTVTEMMEFVTTMIKPK